MYRGQGRGSFHPFALATTTLIFVSLFVMGGSEVPPTKRRADVTLSEAGATLVKDINLANSIMGEIGSTRIPAFVDFARPSEEIYILGIANHYLAPFEQDGMRPEV